MGALRWFILRLPCMSVSPRVRGGSHPCAARQATVPWNRRVRGRVHSGRSDADGKGPLRRAVSFCTCAGSQWEGRFWCTCKARGRPVQSSRGHAGVVTVSPLLRSFSDAHAGSRLARRGGEGRPPRGPPAGVSAKGLRASGGASVSGPAWEPPVCLALQLQVSSAYPAGRSAVFTTSRLVGSFRGCLARMSVRWFPTLVFFGVKSSRQVSFGIIFEAHQANLPASSALFQYRSVYLGITV